jgi:NAD(P)-dependent dehydrogenase (short-subunit alcohol dehydrogenase family)
MFTYELARGLGGTGVTANVLHPGVVRTGFGPATRGALPDCWSRSRGCSWRHHRRVSILAGRGIAKRSAAPGILAAGISGAELRIGSDARHLCFVTCPDCGASGGATPSPSEATTAWPSVSLKWVWVLWSAQSRRLGS